MHSDRDLPGSSVAVAERAGPAAVPAPNRARFLIAAGDTALAEGRLEEAQRRYESASSLARETSATAEEILARNQAGIVAERRGALEDARDHYLRALELQQGGAAEFPEERLRAHLARVLARLGDAAGAQEQLARALEDLEVDRDPAGAGAVYRELGRARLAGGEHGEGASALAQAATLFERAGLAEEVATTRLELGQARIAAGEARAAVAEFSRAHQGLLRLRAAGRGEPASIVAALEGLARAYEAIEQPRWALPHRERALEEARASGDAQLFEAVRARAVAAAHAAGHDELARRFASLQ